MPLQGLTFTAMFPGKTAPGGIAWIAESLTWRPAGHRAYLGHMGKLDCHEYIWPDRISMMYSAAFHIAEIEKLGAPEIVCEPDDDGWERLRQFHRQNHVHFSGASSGPPRVWAVSIASADLSYWGATAGQWSITRQITGGEMQFLEDISHSPIGGLSQKWSKHWSTHSKPQASFMLSQLIQHDEMFCTRPVHRVSD